MINRKLYWLTTIVARVVPILTTLLVTRLYSPEEFGRFQILIAYCGAVIPFVNLKLSFLIAKLREDSAVQRLAVLVMWLIPVSGLVASVVLYSVLDLAGFEYPFLTVLAVIILWGLFEFLVNILGILNRFELGGVGTFLQAIITEGSKLLAGMSNPNFAALIWSWVLGYVVGFVFLLRFSGFSLLRISRRTFAVFGLLVRRNAMKLVYRVTSSVVMMMNNRALIIISALFLSAGDVGLLAIAYLFVNFPSVLFAQPISKLNFTHARELIKQRKHDQLFPDLLKLGIYSLIAGILITLCFQLFFGDIILWILPVHWHGAADYVRVLSFLIPCQFLSSTVAQSFSLFDRDASVLLFNCIVFTIYVAVFYVFRLLGFTFEISLVVLVIAHSTIRVVQFGLLLIYARKFAADAR